MTVLGIPSTRVSEQFVRSRLLNQLSADQIGLVRLQNQISTGMRYSLPSEDAPAALRAIDLSHLLQRKEQVKINLQTNQSFLAATDTALSNVSALIANTRSTALSVADNVSSDAQRTAAAEEIGRALQQLVDTGNQKFRGRYLFAGSQTTTRPFVNDRQFIQYAGNTSELQSYSDIDLLFPTNADGHSVFGALSTQVQGIVDLNPVLTADTRLADLRGGAGISDGSIQISDGTNVSIVDLSNAETIGDVAALIEANPPAGRAVRVSVTSTGLTLQLDAGGGGSLTIEEVAGGTIASELGIENQAGSGIGLFVGSDLDPRLNSTTRLQDLLGTRASAVVASAGVNNDFIVEAKNRGAAYNNVTISFVDNPAILPGGETVAYDLSTPSNPKIIVQIDAGASTAVNVVSAINNDPTVGALYSASIDAFDRPPNTVAGTGAIDGLATATTAGGTGANFDTTGLQIVVGNQTFNVDFSSAETIEDLLNEINGSVSGVVAEINATGTGIDLRARLSGTNFSIGEAGGQTATQLGLRSYLATTRLSDLNHGLGVHEVTGVDFSIQKKDGTLLDIDVSGVASIGDLLDLINNHPNNLVAATKVTAQLAGTGNGIELVTTDASTTAPLQVIRRNFSQAAEDLGFIAYGSDVSAPAASVAGVDSITGSDVNPLEVKGVFNSLIRLKEALLSNDQVQMRRSIELLDDDSIRLNLARGEIGARQQGLDVLQTRLEDEVINLQDSLAKEQEVDLPEAISEMTARQASYEASLRTTAAISQLTLLDFL